jgi:NAD(P)H-dependent FMN reductase
MKVLFLSGSRNRKGQTARIMQAVEKGIKDAGGKTEVIFLTELNLERCRQCDPDGWGLCRREGRCIVEDDLPMLIKKVKAADALVFANPVYFGDLSESMRAFLDRFRRTLFKPGAAPRPGFPMGGGTPAIGINYAGGSGNGTVSSSNTMERVLQTCGLDVVDMIQVRRQNIDIKIPMLEMTGKWLASKPTSGAWAPPPPDKKAGK